MKKRLLFFAIPSVFALLLPSCGDKEKQNQINDLKVENARLKESIRTLDEHMQQIENLAAENSKLKDTIRTLEETDQHYYQIAVNYFDSGRYADSIAKLSEMKSKFPGSPLKSSADKVIAQAEAKIRALSLVEDEAFRNLIKRVEGTDIEVTTKELTAYLQQEHPEDLKAKVKTYLTNYFARYERRKGEKELERTTGVRIVSLYSFWDRSTSSSLVCPQLRITFKNVSSADLSKLVVKSTFTDENKKEIFGEATTYVVGYGDLPLKPGYSKTAFLVSPVGYSGWIPLASMPELIAEIYVNDIVYKSVKVCETSDDQECQRSLESPQLSSPELLSQPPAQLSSVESKIPTPPASPAQAENDPRQQHIQEMISYATKEGGIFNEKTLLDLKLQIETLNSNTPPARGERERARDLDEKGLSFLQSGQATVAIDTFKQASQSDPGDAEIINNLGEAYLRNGEFETAEQALLRTLVLAPGRSNAWATLSQSYAKQGKFPTAVACFANAYRFSRNQETTRQFLQKLTQKDDEQIRQAAQQTLQLSLIQTIRNESPPSTEEQSARNNPPSKRREDDFPSGVYRVIRSTRLLHEPREDADPVAELRNGTKVHVVEIMKGGWLRIESSRADRPPGYLHQEDVVAIRGEGGQEEEK